MSFSCAIPDPMKELNAANRAKTFRFTAPADQNLKTERVVLQALENYCIHMQNVGMPVKT